MLKATIEIDNHTASGLSPANWIFHKILKDAISVKFEAKNRIIYETEYATITIKNLKQI